MLVYIITLAIPVSMVVVNFCMIVSSRVIDRLENALLATSFAAHDLATATAVRALCSGALAAAAAVLVTGVHPPSGGSGLPELKGYLNGSPMPGFFVLRGNVVRPLGAVLATSSGLCVGREGPLVVAGGGIGIMVTQILAGYCFKSWVALDALGAEGGELPVSDKHRFAYTKRCGCIMGGAAGLAAAFSAPIGGVLYMLEETTVDLWPKELTFKTFVVTTIAMLGTHVCLNLSGSKAQSLFIDQSDHPFDDYRGIFRWYQLPFMSLLGAMAGVLSAAYSVGLAKVWKLRERSACCAWRHGSRTARIVEAALYAVLTAIVLTLVPCLMNCSTLPGGQQDFEQDEEINIYAYYLCDRGEYNKLAAVLLPIGWEEAIKYLYDACMTTECRTRGAAEDVVAMPIALLTYFVLSIGTAGLSLPMGTFVPNMFLGALLGRWYRQFLQHSGLVGRWQLELAHPGIYAFLGSGACLAGFNHMSVAIVVMLVELSSNISMSLGLMVCICMSRKVSKLLVQHDYCDQLITLKKVPYLASQCPVSLRQDAVAIGLHCDRVGVESMLPCLAPLAAVQAALDSSPKLRHFPVVGRGGDPGQFLGLVPRSRLERAVRYGLGEDPGLERQASCSSDPNAAQGGCSSDEERLLPSGDTSEDESPQRLLGWPPFFFFPGGGAAASRARMMQRSISWEDVNPEPSVRQVLFSAHGDGDGDLVPVGQLVNAASPMIGEDTLVANIYPLFTHASLVQAICILPQARDGSWLGVFDREHLVRLIGELEGCL